MVKKIFLCVSIVLSLLTTTLVMAQEGQPFFLPSGKVFLTFNWDLSMKGSGIGSESSVINQSSGEELKGTEDSLLYSYKNFFLKSGYIFTDIIGAYINVGLSEKAFELDYNNYDSIPSIEQTFLYYQQYYHLEGGFRLNISYNCYMDFGAYYGIQKGDMSLTVQDESPFLWPEAKKGDITIKEDDRTKINNDFGITAAIGMLSPIVQDKIYFDISARFINGVYPSFEVDGKSSGDFEWKLYNMSLGLVLGITAVF